MTMMIIFALGLAEGDRPGDFFKKVLTFFFKCAIL